MDKLCFTIMLNAMKQSNNLELLQHALWWEHQRLLREIGLFGFSLRGTKTALILSMNLDFFFFVSLEVFKRKTYVSAEHRMSTLGITSNLSESMLWRAEYPPKSAWVKMNFFTKNWRASLETGNKVRQVSLSPPFAWSWWTRNTHRYVWANSVRFHKMSSRFWEHFWKLALK